MMAAAGTYGDGDIQSYKGEELADYPCVYLTSNGLFDFKDLRSFESDYSVSSELGAA